MNERSADKRVPDNLLKRVQEDNELDTADLKVMRKFSERYELPIQRAMDIRNAKSQPKKGNPHRLPGDLVRAMSA